MKIENRSQGAQWPYTVPEDFRRRLEDVLGQRSYGAAEVWGEIRDWLELKGVQMPEGIKVAPPIEGAQQDQ